MLNPKYEWKKTFYGWNLELDIFKLTIIGSENVFVVQLTISEGTLWKSVEVEGVLGAQIAAYAMASQFFTQQAQMFQNKCLDLMEYSNE